jgi:DNA topoisomerase I
MKTLVIVESPAKCKKIEAYLGVNEYTCVASYGHFRQIASLKDVNDVFDIKFVEMDDKKKYIKLMKTAISKAKDVVLATDDDREGEAIAWHICDAFGLDVETTPRIVFQEITKTALMRAIKNPGRVNMGVVNAQHTRQIVDMALGFKISPLLWSAMTKKSKSGLSAGRCQTPALRLVHENNMLVNEHPGTMSYTTIGYFTSKNIPFELAKHHVESESIETFLEESVNFEHNLTCSSPTDVTKKPPIPLITSSMQQHASSVLGYSPRDAMALCQRLYEGGHITYMRTDSPVLSKDFLVSAMDFIEVTYGKNYGNALLIDGSGTNPNGDKKDSGGPQEAHEAIRPTVIGREELPESMGNKEKRMYAFIRNHTLKCCMVPANMKKIIATVTSPENSQYRYSALAVAFAGFMRVDGVDDDPFYAFLTSFKNGSIVEYNSVTSKCTLKNTKSRVNEAKLVQLLEDRGIGRPSTFSSIVDKIQSRGYVKKKTVEGRKIDVVNYSLVEDTIEETCETSVFGTETNRLVVMPLGELVLEFLGKHFDPILNYEYTKNMETTLDTIAMGGNTKECVCRDYYTDISKSILLYNGGKHRKVSHRFDDVHEFIIGAHGPVIKCTNGETVTWKKVRDGVTLEQIRSTNAKLDDVVDISGEGRVLGTYKDLAVMLKNGKYGPYVVYNDKTIGMKSVDKLFEKITIADVIDLLDEEGGNVGGNPTIIRVVNASTSVRKGKFGPYIYYKTAKMTKPRFVKLGNLKNTFLSCSKKEIIDLVENS